MPTLIIHLPGHPSEEHALNEEVVTLGRMTGNAVVLPHPSVSQSHARIMHVGSDYFLKDLKSTNGTLLNGQPIKETQLGDGDQLKLGEVVAVFRLGPASASVSTAVVAAMTPASPPASRLEKADTSVLSAKAKTSFLRRVTPVVEVNAPVPPAPKRKSSTALLLSVLIGVAAAGIVGFLAWRFAGGDTIKPVVAAPTSPTTQPTLVQNTSSTNTPVAPIDTPLAAELPMTNQEVPPLVAEPADAPVQTQTRSLTELLAILRLPDLKERRRAAREISALESGASNAVLNLRIALLQDPDPDVRVWLVAALVSNQTYDQASIPILVDGLKLENAALRKQACATLTLIPYDASGKATVVPALKAATEDENEEVRKAAIASLKAIAPEEVTGK